MRTTRLGGMVLILALAGVSAAEEPAAPPKESMACCQQMMAKQKEHQTSLDAKTASMNAAQGQEKVDAIAAVVNELVEQHRAMHSGPGCPGGCGMMGMQGMHGMTENPPGDAH